MKHRFPFMSVPSTPWRDILYQVCTKDDLIDNCELFNISYQASMNKAALSMLIEKAWLEQTEDKIRMLPLTELRSLQTILHAGGTIKPSETMSFAFLEDAKLILTLADDPIFDSDLFDEFRPNYSMPDNLRLALSGKVDVILNDQAYLDLNRYEQLLLGMVHLYGVLTEHQLSSIWEQTLNEKWDSAIYRKVVKEKVMLKMEVYPLFHEKNVCFVSQRVEVPSKLYDIIHKRNDLEYAIYCEDYILSYANSPLSGIKDGAIKALLTSLASISDGDIAASTILINVIWNAFQHEAPFSELMNRLSHMGVFEKVTKREVEAFIPILIDFTNAIPLWILKGHSPKTLHAKSNQKMFEPLHFSNPVGGNEPCPCGSGLKYKNCCGAN